MTEIDHCAENALAERMNGILKQEYWLGREFRTKADALRAVAQGVWLYNTRRPHTALRYRIPRPSARLGPELNPGGVRTPKLGESGARVLPAPLQRGVRRVGPRRYDMSCELAVDGTQLMSALPHSPTTPSSRFAEK